MYNYNARVVRIIDGDTVVLNVDLGFRLWREDSFRLSDINAPELKGETYEAGLAAKEYLASLLPVGEQFSILTRKSPDKYGRYLATIFRGDQTVNFLMVFSGHAIRYEG